MNYRWLVGMLGALLLIAAFAMAATPSKSVSVQYGTTVNYSLDLNKGDTAFLSVTLTGIDHNASTIYVRADPSISDRVFCAPSPSNVSSTYTANFTCVVTPGGALDGYITFVALDANNNVLSSNTRVHLVVTYAEQWFTTKAVAKVHSTINVGGHAVVVKNASFLYATLSVDNSVYTVFINDESSIADNLYAIYKGYDPDTHEVFIEFKSHQPISASVVQKSYYLAAPHYVYPSDDNHIIFDVTTNCSAVKYRYTTTSDWQTMSVSDNRAHFDIDANVSHIYLQCSDDDSVKSVVYVKQPPVIKVAPDENTFRSWCTSHNYITKDQCPKTDCSSYCAANGWVRPPAGETCQFVPVGSNNNSSSSRLFWGLVILLILGGLYYMYHKGMIKPPSHKESDEVEQAMPIEEANDIQ